jgi:hypothetical protein
MKLLICTVLLAVMQTTPPVPRQATKNQNTQESQQIHGNADDANQSTPQQAAPAPPPESPAAHSANSKTGEDSQVTQERAISVSKLPTVSVADSGWLSPSVLAAVIYDVLTAFLIFVGCWGVRSAVRTLHEMKRQRAVMGRQLTEMRLQLRTMEKGLIVQENEKRPRVRIEPGSPVLVNNGTSYVPFDSDFWCPTPCFISSFQVEAYVFSGFIDKIAEFVPIKIDSPILNNRKINEYAVIFQEFIGEEVADIARGRLSLYLRGFIEYRGTHLMPDQPSYRTNFRKKWIPHVGIEIPGLSYDGHWENYGTAEDNQQT